MFTQLRHVGRQRITTRSTNIQAPQRRPTLLQVVTQIRLSVPCRAGLYL